MRVLSQDLRAAKLAKLIEIEGFEDAAGLFACAAADSVWPRVMSGAVAQKFSRPRLAVSPAGSASLRPAQV